MKSLLLKLQFFADGGENGSENQSGNAGNGNGGRQNAGYTYEQLEEIASSRAEKASRSALADFFRKQGMSEEEVTTAISDYRTKQKEKQPNVAQITKERDDALREITQMKNEKLLTQKGVKAEDLDYVSFKVNQLVTDKKDFKTAMEEYLKQNPKFTGQTYKVSTGVSSGNASSGTETKNEQINSMIRGAFGR